jgi:hypothetical protein
MRAGAVGNSSRRNAKGTRFTCHWRLEFTFRLSEAKFSFRLPEPTSRPPVERPSQIRCTANVRRRFALSDLVCRRCRGTRSHRVIRNTAGEGIREIAEEAKRAGEYLRSYALQR